MKNVNISIEMDNKRKIIDKLQAFFRGKEGIEMAFLFGSEAKGRAINESDVDIAVWFKDGYNMPVVERLWREVEHLIDRNVDLIVLNQARPTIAWAAMRGKALLIRNYTFFIKQMLLISDEAEFIQDFTLDLFWRREKLRRAT